MGDIIILQARLSSSRLPGKVLMPLYEGKSILDLILEKLTTLNLPFVLATTTNGLDDDLITWAKDRNIEVFRGSENNVMGRFMDCAQNYGAENIIRVCSDNPFLQMQEIQKYFELLRNERVDYISYSDDHQVPAIRKHWGLFVEGLRLSALKRADDMLQDDPKSAFYQEHVTNYLYGHPTEFKVLLEPAPIEIISRDDLRYTIDTPDDFENMIDLMKLLNGNHQISLKDLVEITDKNRRIKEVMKIGISKYDK